MITMKKINRRVRKLFTFVVLWMGVVSGFASTPIVTFDWTMESRFGLDNNGDHIIDAFDTPAKVNPGKYNVKFDACSIPIDKTWKTYPIYYEWKIDGLIEDNDVFCLHTVPLTEGDHQVSLTLRNARGDETIPVEQTIRVQDWLIVSMGDSYASGEGNPDKVPDYSGIANLDECGFNTLDDIWVQIESLQNIIDTTSEDLNQHLYAHRDAMKDALDEQLANLDGVLTATDIWAQKCYTVNVFEFDFLQCTSATDNLITQLNLYGANGAEIVGEGFNAVFNQIQLFTKDAKDAYTTAEAAITGALQTVNDTERSIDELRQCLFDGAENNKLGATWVDNQCHRSMNSKEAIAALALENSDPKTSVTFVSTACSGAEIMNGILDNYSGATHPLWGDFTKCMAINKDHQQCCDEVGYCKKPQISEVAELVGDREIDALLISIGGNDAGFGDIVTGCLATDYCNEDTAQISIPSNYLRNLYCPAMKDTLSSYEPSISQETIDFTNNICTFNLHNFIGDAIFPQSAKEIFDERKSHLPDLYEALNNRIITELAMIPGHIYITEYPGALKNENGEYCISSNYPNPLVMLPGFQSQEVTWADQTMMTELNGAVHSNSQFGWHVVDGIYDLYTRDQAGIGHGYCSTTPWFRRFQDSLFMEPTIAPVSKLYPNILAQQRAAPSYQGMLHPSTDGNRAVANEILYPLLRNDLYISGDISQPRPLSGKPTAKIASTYRLNEGETFQPTAKASDLVYGSELAYFWSASPWIFPVFDNPINTSPNIMMSQSGHGRLSLVVTNPAGISAIANANLIVDNMPPIVTLNFKGAKKLSYQSYYAGVLYTFGINIFDQGVLDSHEIYIDWGDGSEPTDIDHNSSTHIDIDHRFDTNGTYLVTVLVRDYDNGMDIETSNIIVKNHPLGTDDDGDGYTEWEGDCDDTNRFYVYPGANEICDYIDNDCNGLVDEVGCGVIYVDSTATGANDGSSWADAYTDLQSAITNAVEGQQLWVAKGTYKPGLTQSDSFVLNKSLRLFGGFIGNETKLSKRNINLNQTILSGDIGVEGDNSDNSYHVVQISHAASSLRDRIDGFTIAYGNAIGDTTNPDGGGIVTPRNLIVSNVTFLNNHARNGGAAGNVYDGRGQFINCRFLGNSADEKGGAVYLNYGYAIFSNSIFSGNEAQDGGAIAAEEYSQFQLLQSTLSHNQAVYTGGAIWMYNSTSVTSIQDINISGTILWNNSITDVNGKGREIATIGDNFNVEIDYSALTPGTETIYDQTFSSITNGSHNLNTELYPIAFVSANGTDTVAGTLDDNLHLSITSGGINSVSAATIPADSSDIDNDADVFEPLPYDLDLRDRIVEINADIGAYERNPMTWYVDQSAIGTQDGKSWQNAFIYLQDALAMALPYDTILVAQGIYKPDRGVGQNLNDRFATFNMIDGIGIFGGYKSGGSEHDPKQYVSILSGDIGVENVTSDNSYHVVTAKYIYEAGLNGFTIMGGNANAGYHPENKGGGVIFNYSDMSLNNCIVKDNYSAKRGGGIWIGHRSPSIENTILQNNRSVYGGGLAMEHASQPNIYRCSFLGNSATDDGGALYSSASTLAKITKTLFSGNMAVDKTGGILNVSNDNMQLENCTLSNNQSAFGGGMFVASGSSVTLKNSILWNNSAASGSQIGVRDSTFTSTWSDMQGGVAAIYEEGTNTITADNIMNFDPLFVNQKGGDNLAGTLDDDLHVNILSLAIDAGDPASSYNNEPSNNGARINLGAYGDTDEATTTRTAGGDTLYVNRSAVKNSTGLSWDHALASLQYALNTAKSGDDIWVAEGIYTPDNGPQFDKGDRNASFHLKEGVKLYGGFSSGDYLNARDPKGKSTILSGDLNGDDRIDMNPTSYDDNTQHVVVGSGVSPSTIIDGFTIRGGYATSTHAYPQNGGGGMYNEDGSPTITHCVFEYNLADSRGGGAILNHGNSSPEIGYNIFKNNRGGNGGAVYNAYSSNSHIHHSLFIDNSGSYGGAIELVDSNPLIENCSFKNNMAMTRGGALRLYASSPVVKNSIFWNNLAPSGQGSQIGINNSTLNMSHSDLQGGQSDIYQDSSTLNWGAGNIENIDPLFTDNLAHLYFTSPCLDTGDPASPYTDEPAPNGARVNMGVWGGTIEATRKVTDSDGDGIEDSVELTSCTNPYDADSDDDVLLDGQEDKNHNGIVDEGETNPCNNDTDGDRIQDGTELGYPLSYITPYTNPDNFQPDLDPSTITDPLLEDTDRDGLTDGQEDLNTNGRFDAGEKDPLKKEFTSMPAIIMYLLN